MKLWKSWANQAQLQILLQQWFDYTIEITFWFPQVYFNKFEIWFWWLFSSSTSVKTTKMLTNFCLTSSITMMHRPTVDLSQAIESAVQTFPTPTLKAWCHGVLKACRDLKTTELFVFFFPFEPSQLQKITQLENVAWKYWDSGIAGNWWDPVRLPVSMKFLLFEVPSVSFVNFSLLPACWLELRSFWKAYWLQFISYCPGSSLNKSRQCFTGKERAQMLSGTRSK